MLGYGFLSFARKYKKQLLNIGLDSLKWIKETDLSSGHYSKNYNIRFKTSMVR